MNAISAPAAWQMTTGSRDVRVCVVDTGVEAGHPDLAANMVGSFSAVPYEGAATDAIGHGTHCAGELDFAPGACRLYGMLRLVSVL